MPASLDPAATITLYYETTIDGDLINTATVTGTPPLGPDPTDDDTAVVEEAETDLELKKKLVSEATVESGGLAVWELSVTNLGPADNPGPLTVTDVIPEGLELVSAAGDGWSESSTNGVLICIYNSGLAAGEAAPPILVTTEVVQEETGPIVNAASVGSPVTEITLENNDDLDVVEVAEATISTEALPRTGASIAASVALALTLIGGGRALMGRRRVVRGPPAGPR